MTTPAASRVARPTGKRPELDLSPRPIHTRTIRLQPGGRFGPLRMVDHGFHVRQIALISPVATPAGSTLRVAGTLVDAAPGEVHFVDVSRGICIDNPTAFERVDVLYTVADTHPLARTARDEGLAAETAPVGPELQARRLLQQLPSLLLHRVEHHGAPLLLALRSAQALDSLGRLQRAQVRGREVVAEVVAPADALASVCAWLAPPAAPKFESLSWTRLARALRSSLDGVDVRIAVLPYLVGRLLPTKYVRAPGSISVRADTPSALHKWNTSEPPLGKYRRRATREGVRVDILRSSEALHRAHFDFYRPFLERRFSGTAHPHCLAAYAGYDWEVLAARTAAGWVAAGTALVHHDRYRFLSLGYAPEQQGASHALYAAAVQRAAELGLPQVDLGPERPFLGNQVLNYKAQWGATVRRDPWCTHVLGLGYRRRSPALEALLRRSPLVAIAGDHLAQMSPERSDRFAEVCKLPHTPLPQTAC